MVIKIKYVCLVFALLTITCHAEISTRRHYTATQYLKNYALSACLADGYQASEIVNDATAGANGYKELGSLSIDAYNDALVMVSAFLKKEYSSQGGERLTVMKCIDLYNSKELDKLARKYAAAK
jgi:Type VI secretion system (T6SS), amidase immunity protein